jgi:hypothetical protein
MAILKSRGVLLVVLVVLLAAAGRLIDVRALSGPIKGDEATYISMAFSLAQDGDLFYEPEDYQRFVELYGDGPSGIFLKRRYTLSWDGKSPVASTESLAYGKALIYPAAAAPFVFLGGLGGLVVFNWLMLAGCVWAGATFCRAVAGTRRGWLMGVAFIAASVVPIYAAWLTSEIFNFTLIFAAYFLWLYKKVAPAQSIGWLGRPSTTLLAAALIGAATFSKATNAALVGPLLIDLLFQRRFLQTGAAGIAFVFATAGLFGLNGLITGETNYQGAEDARSRRSFYNRYPFDAAGTRFEETGSAMVTNDADTGRVLGSEIVEQIPLNLGYFMVGRHAGLIPFYMPGVVIAILWIARARRAPLWQWTTFLCVVGSCLVLVVLLPDCWNGCGGPPGNRYFLSLYPPLLFLLPAGVALWPQLLATVGGLAFVGRMLLSPYDASAATWRNVEYAPLKWLPIELTLLNDLPVRLNQQRGGILFVPEPTVLVYYMDGNTYSAEGQGFWIAGADRAQTVIRSERPLRRVDFVISAPIANTVTGDFGGHPISVDLRPGIPVRVQVSRPEGVRYHQSHAYVLTLTTANGFVPAEREPGSGDTRNLGVFVQSSFFYDEADVR